MNRRMRRAAAKARRVAREPDAQVKIVVPETPPTRPTGHDGAAPHTGINPKGGKR